jgi:hypothetical protein
MQRSAIPLTALTTPVAIAPITSAASNFDQLRR